MGSLGACVDGNRNVVMGKNSGDAITDGDDNTAVGHNAGTAITTGNDNTFIGASSGYITQSGVRNIAIGAAARQTGEGINDSIAIGYNLAVAANTFGFGKDGNIVSNVFTSNATFARNSDLHKKTNIESTDLGLSFINELRPVTFNWKPNHRISKTL